MDISSTDDGYFLSLHGKAGSRMTRSHRKAFGQHFLHEPAIIERIVAEIEPREDAWVVEIGPGEGALTGPLLQMGFRVLAIEKDRRLAMELRERVNGGMMDRLEIVTADFLKLDPSELESRFSSPVPLISNLPYSVAAPIWLKLAHWRVLFSTLILMVQKEVGDRFCARVGTRDYGILAVLGQLYFSINKVVRVSPGAFSPPPKVESVVLRFDPSSDQIHGLPPFLPMLKFVKLLFSRRRKTLANVFRSSPINLEKAGIDPRRRAETLELAEVLRLYQEYHSNE